MQAAQQGIGSQNAIAYESSPESLSRTMPDPRVVVIAESSADHMLELADRLGLDVVESLADVQQADWLLHLYQGRVCLSHAEQSHLQHIMADFSAGTRRLQRPQQLAGELLIKAIGGIAKPERARTIIDATAGLGADSLLMAAAGHEVTMLERSLIVAALLSDALQRLAELPGTLRLVEDEARSYLASLAEDRRPDIIYLDPMFPADNKSALSCKGLQALKELLPLENGESDLLATALEVARYRVVVKRPLRGPTLPGPKPGFCFQGKLIRYDCYALRQL